MKKKKTVISKISDKENEKEKENGNEKGNGNEKEKENINEKENGNGKESGKSKGKSEKSREKSSRSKSRKRLYSRKKKFSAEIPKTKLKPLNDDKKRQMIEDVIKRKKLDGLKKKLNEFTKDKLMEKYNEMKLREKIERRNTKKDLLLNMKLDRPAPKVINEDDDISSIYEDEIEKNEKNNGENDTDIGSDSESIKSIETDFSELSSIDISSKLDDNSYSIKSSDFTLLDSGLQSSSSSLVDLQPPPSSTSSKKETPLIKKIYQKSTPKSEINKASSVASIKNKSENNEYLKIDYNIAQAYFYFCKKVSVPPNDCYFLFISKSLTKAQVNDFLNIKQSNNDQNNNSINYSDDYTNFTYNYTNEVTVDGGTSGFKKRQTYLFNKYVI